MLRFPPVTRRNKTNRRGIMVEDSHRTLAGVMEEKGTKHTEESKMGCSMRRPNSCPKAVCSVLLATCSVSNSAGIWICEL